MTNTETAIAVFDTHGAAEAAIRTLAKAGFPMTELSIIGKGYHTEEQVVGFTNIGDRMRIWGGRCAVWGGLWGLFFGGVMMVVPVVGHLVVLGYLATVLASTVEGAVVVGGLSALGAALASLGIRKDSVIAYQTALEADGYLVAVHGDAAEVERGKQILGTLHATSIAIHSTGAIPIAA